MAGIQEVARKAGVSQSTVSYVLSGRRPISETTRERVLKAIDELNYRPHAGARALASTKTHVLGLVPPLRPGVNEDVIMQFVAGIATRARHYEHDVLLVTEPDASGIEGVSLRSMVDGFIVMDVESRDSRLPTLAALRQPSVLIGMPEDPGSLSCIDFDFENAGSMAVRKLAAAGHTRIALIGSSPAVHSRGTSYAVRLARGAEREAEAHHIALQRLACGDDPLEASPLIDELVESGITGLIVHNEAALPGVITALARRGPEVANSVAVVAIGPKSLLLAPLLPMTVIDIPGTTIGSTAVDMLMGLINDRSLPERRLVAPRVE